MRNKFQKEKFGFSLVAHNNAAVIWISFPNNVYLKNHLKEFVKAKWNQTHKSWYCTDHTAKFSACRTKVAAKMR